MAQPPFIEIQHLRKTFKQHLVLNDININIEYGDIFGIIGKSGSGKTTLLNLLMGFLKPTDGHIVFQSRDIENDMQNVRQQFGFTAQEGSFYPKLTVRENMEYFGELYNVTPRELKEKIPRILKSFGLEEAEHVVGYKLSIGMQKRLDIACGLIHDPKVLLLDEPTENLDPVLRREILNLLRDINKKKGVTILLTSHLLEEVEYICNKVAILHRNTVLASGTLNQLKDLYTKNMEIHLETTSGNYSKLLPALKKRNDIKSITPRDRGLVIYTPKPEPVLKFALDFLTHNNERLLDIGIEKPSLNEVFESFTKDKEIKEKVEKK